MKATRMELLKLKRQLKTAYNGHKLLKEKRDGLVKKFLEIIKSAKEIRRKMEESLSDAFKIFTFATANLSLDELVQILSSPLSKVQIISEEENVMGISIPKFKYSIKGDTLCYSVILTSKSFDIAIKKFQNSLEYMIKLAEIEHSLKLLSYEIEKTRRRVNALEYVIIPEIENRIKFISAKLDEQERSDKVIRMKLKELLKS